MQALILAGGEGTRLRPLTMTVPKPVVPLANRPFISYMIDWLHRHGFDEIVMSCGFLADGVREVLGTGDMNGVTVSYVDEPEPLGTAGAVKLAEPFLGERFAVLNGDVLTDLDISRLHEFHEQRGAVATLGLYPVEDPSSYGVVVTDDDGRVQEFLEKPAPGTAPTNHINAGMYVLEHEVLDRIESGRAVSFEREVFPSLVGAGLHALPLSGYWMDIGTPDRYLQATRDILHGAVETPVSPSQNVNGAMPPVLIGSGCEISPDAGLGPDATLGDGSRIRAGASVSCASIHADVLVEEDAVVEESIVGARARVGAGARLEGETIIGEDAVVPPGTHLTGGRLPADG
jgi:mannose-1-phosphate guanylyltransferase